MITTVIRYQYQFFVDLGDWQNQCKTMSNISHSIMNQRQRNEINLLLQSARHPCMDRLLKGFPTNHIWRYTFDSGFRQYLHLTITMNPIDENTAASNAFIYACWLGDLEVVMQIIHDLHELIDVNRCVLGMSAIEWASSSICTDRWGANSANVCRYLISYFGSKINANPHSGLVLRACAEHGCIDIVAYLVTKYGAKLSHNRNTANIFALLVDNNYETEAEAYTHLFYNHLAQDVCENVLLPSIRGSMHMFQMVLDMFGSKADPFQARCLLNALCESHEHDKLRVALDVYADHVEPETFLVRQWVTSYQIRICKANRLAESHSITGQLIAERCVSRLEGDGVQVALALGCLPVHESTSGPLRLPSNLDLIDAVFDHNLDQINKDPRLVHHALLECLSLGDIDTFTHILNRRGPSIYQIAFEFACEAGDLEAVSHTLYLGSEFGSTASRALVSACIRGDADMAELLISHAGDSIDEEYYRKAFRGACYSNHPEVVRVMSAYRDRIDYRPDTDYDLVLVNVEPDIIGLLNSIFDTTIDPTVGTCYSSSFTMGARSKGFLVQYGDTRTYYTFDQV